jgi:hypothetical protein
MGEPPDIGARERNHHRAWYLSRVAHGARGLTLNRRPFSIRCLMAEGRSGEQSNSERRDEQGGGGLPLRPGCDEETELLRLARDGSLPPAPERPQRNEAGFGWCETHQAWHLATETRILPADVDGVPVHVTEQIRHAGEALAVTHLVAYVAAQPGTERAWRCQRCPGVWPRWADISGGCVDQHAKSRELDELQARLRDTVRRTASSNVVEVGGGFMILDEEPATYAGTFAPYERTGHVCTLDCPNPWREGRLDLAILALLHDGIPRGASTIAAELGMTPWATPGYVYEDVMRECGYQVSAGRLVATPTEGESEHMLTLPGEG